MSWVASRYRDQRGIRKLLVRAPVCIKQMAQKGGIALDARRRQKI